jgi:hypothetical protein
VIEKSPSAELATLVQQVLVATGARSAAVLDLRGERMSILHMDGSVGPVEGWLADNLAWGVPPWPFSSQVSGTRFLAAPADGSRNSLWLVVAEPAPEVLELSDWRHLLQGYVTRIMDLVK